MIYYIFYIILIILALYYAIKISIADFRHRIIPDKYLFPLMLIGLSMIAFFSHPIDIQNAVIGAIFGYTIALFIGCVFEHFAHTPTQHPAIGMGDIKLIGVGGLWLGIHGLSIALVISCISGAIWAKIHKTKFIPFGPFFLLGGFLAFITIKFLL